MRSEYVLERLLKVQDTQSNRITDAWVYLKNPERIGPIHPEGDRETKVEFAIETVYGNHCDFATGGDDISALLGALIIAKAYLHKIERENSCKIYWLEPDDLRQANFWGYQVKFANDAVED